MYIFVSIHVGNFKIWLHFQDCSYSSKAEEIYDKSQKYEIFLTRHFFKLFCHVDKMYHLCDLFFDPLEHLAKAFRV